MNPNRVIAFFILTLFSSYGSLVYTAGTANDKGKDWINAGQASIYRSHILGNFQAFYGANKFLSIYPVTFFSNHVPYYS